MKDITKLLADLKEAPAGASLELSAHELLVSYMKDSSAAGADATPALLLLMEKVLDGIARDNLAGAEELGLILSKICAYSVYGQAGTSRMLH
jgi:hypothetical protein